jgi:endonuclease/exonuclease/phosphatase family metal-dependent hydrolase
MVHLSRLITSTRSQVIFISETRNSSISRTALINHFPINDAFVISAQGRSGGLWLLWNNEVDITVLDSSQNFIFCLCINKTSQKKFVLVCMYGDPHHRLTDVIWGHVQNFVALNPSTPFFCMGDMNELMHAYDKIGPSAADFHRMNSFCTHVKRCGFVDLGYDGPAYTWTNKHFSSIPTYERLDRCFGNAEWCVMYPATTIYHLPMLYSDHAPILAVLDSPRPRVKKPFRFENGWLYEQDFQEVAQTSWNRSSQQSFHQKTQFLASDLKKWRRKTPNNKDLLAKVDEFLQQQSLPPSQQNHSLQNQLHE